MNRWILALTIVLCLPRPTVAQQATEPSLTLGIFAAGTNPQASPAPTPIFTAPLTATCNQTPVSGWPTNTTPATITISSAMASTVYAVDDPLNSGKVCNVDISGAAKAALPNLTAGNAYVIAVSAANGSLASGWSAAGVPPFQVPAVAPAVPTHLRLDQ